jgi:uncharacterized membrane protein
MDPLLLTLRLIHVLAGALWLGFAIFIAFYLGPAMDDGGPEGGKIMVSLQRRGLPTAIPLLALATVLSGMWLFWRISGGQFSDYLRSPTGLTLAIGWLVSILAFAVGMAVTRPAMMKVGELMQSLAGAANPAEREQILATAAGLRSRASVAGRVGGVMLILTAASMAVARYL